MKLNPLYLKAEENVNKISIDTSYDLSTIITLAVCGVFLVAVAGAIIFLIHRRRRPLVGRHQSEMIQKHTASLVLGQNVTYTMTTVSSGQPQAERPYQLKKSIAVRMPTTAAGQPIYLKKSPSPTGNKTPPGISTGSKKCSPAEETIIEQPEMQLCTITSTNPFECDINLNEVNKTNNKTSTNTSLKTVNSNQISSLGRLNFRLKYVYKKHALYVTVISAVDLHSKSNSNTLDPYIKLQLLPEKQHKAKTRVVKKSSSPTYEEEFVFYSIPANQLETISLHFVVLNFDRYSRDEIIGQVIYQLDQSQFDALEKQVTLCREIEPRSIKLPTSGNGELLLSLCHQPAANRLTVVILKAKNLPKMDMTGLSDPYVKIYLMYRKQRISKKKTHVKKRTLSPVFNESFIFDLPADADQLNEYTLELQLLDYDRVTRNEVIGKLVLGSNAGDSARRHWDEVLSSPRRQIAEWHKLE